MRLSSLRQFIPLGIALIIVGSLYGAYKIFIPESPVGATILFPYQGGTGKGTAAVGDVGKYLKISDDSPFTYSFDTPAGGGGSGTVGTSTNETSGRLSYWTTTSGTPALLGEVATTTLTATAPVVLSNPISVIGSTASILTCNTAASGVAGCLSNTAFDTFNNKQATISATYPIILTGAALTFPATSTLYGTGTGGQVLMWSGSAPLWAATSTDVWTDTENTAAAYVNASAAMTGTFDGVDFGNGTLAQNALWVGGAAAIPSELTLGTAGTILGSTGGTVGYITTSSMPVAGEVTGTLGATVVTSNATWTAHNSYPTACAAGAGVVTGIGDTLTCAATSTLGLLTTNVAEGTNLYWTNTRFDNRLSATTSLINLTSLLGLVNASSTYFSSSYASSTLYYGAGLATCNLSTDKLTWVGGKFGCGSDSTGSGGAGTISTSTTPTIGNLSYWTGIGWPSTLGTVATTTLTATAPMVLSNAINVIGPSASVLTCTAATGSVPGCLSAADWATFNNKVSSSSLSGDEGITYVAASGLISFDCSEVNGTGITCTGEDLTLDATGDWTGTIDGNNFLGGAIGAGDIIYGVAPGVFTELASTTSGTILSLTNGKPAWIVTSTIPVSGDVAGTLSALTISADAIHDSMIDWGSGANQVDLADIPGGISGANTWDLGGATSLEIPNGGPTVDTTGEIGIDTTTGEFKWSYNGSSLGIKDPFDYASFTYATSTTWAGTTTIPLGTAFRSETWTGVQCFTDVGTLNVVFLDGTNVMNLLNASTTVGTVTLSSNNTFTASEKRYVNVGTPATAPTKISCTVKKQPTAD